MKRFSLLAKSVKMHLAGKVIITLCFLLNSHTGFGQTGQALDFDASNANRVILPFVVNGSYTKEAWIKPSSASLSNFPNLVSGNATAFYLNNGKLSAGHAASGYANVQDPVSLVADTWYHIAVTYNSTSGEMNLYKDGALVSTFASAPAYIETIQYLSFFSGGNYFTGQMDEVRFWNYARTQIEISAAKDCELTGDEPNLLAYYNFNQGVAAGNNATVNSLLDTQDKCVAANGIMENFLLTGATSNWVTPGPTFSGTCNNSFSNINITGNGNCIASGDLTASLNDHTNFGSFLFLPITRTFTIQNTGNSPLNITNIVIGGVNASEFSILSAPASSVAGGSSTAVSISFNPIGFPGNRTATITINNDDTDESSFTFAIEGIKSEQGKSLDFDGLNDKVDLPFTFSGSYTKEAWIKTFKVTNFPNILSGTGTALFLNNGKLAAGHANGSFGQAVDPVPLNINTWYHVAVTYDAVSQVMKLHKNGALVLTVNGVPGYTETEQKIGSFLGANYFYGRIDQVRFWTVAKTDTEILNSYNCSLSGDEPDLLALYNFSNGISEGNNSGLTTLQDVSDKCNSNNGTLTGFALTGNFSNWISDSVTLSGNCAALFPNINLTGNSICIINGDATPSAADNTDFGNTPGNTKTFGITNTGTASLTISGINFTGTDNSMFTVSAAPVTPLLPGLSTSFTVQFTPTSVGEKFATINIANDDADEATYTFNIKGTGITAPTGPVVFTAGATSLCQNAPDETYTATAENSTSITYSVLPVEAGVINATTGVMNWDAAFSGPATITAIASGLDGTTTADRNVTINPSTGTTSFTAGATTACQDAADETYTATAANNTSIVYAVLPVEAGIINASTGVMNWAAAFSGTATITATATGLCGTTNVDRVVTVNVKPNIGSDITIYHNCVGETSNLIPLFNTTGLTAVWNTATPESVAPGLYRLIVSNGSGCSDTAFVNIVLEVAVWTGTISSDWHTAGNWNINKVPGAQTHVIIDNTSNNECIISTANATAASVQSKTGTVTKIENNREIIISGNCNTLPAN